MASDGSLKQFKGYCMARRKKKLFYLLAVSALARRSA